MGTSRSMAERSGMARFSESALVILRERYLRHGESGHTREPPTAMLERVARAASTA
jgi:ribonucleotide reductase alpha subunit